jgi:hypothetical protein
MQQIFGQIHSVEVTPQGKALLQSVALRGVLGALE